jgi:hypothetical protein
LNRSKLVLIVNRNFNVPLHISLRGRFEVEAVPRPHRGIARAPHEVRHATTAAPQHSHAPSNLRLPVPRFDKDGSGVFSEHSRNPAIVPARGRRCSRRLHCYRSLVAWTKNSTDPRVPRTGERIDE